MTMEQDSEAPSNWLHGGLGKKIFALLLVATVVAASCLVLGVMDVFSLDDPGASEQTTADNPASENASIRTLNFLASVLSVDPSNYNVSVQAHDMPELPSIFTAAQKLSLPTPETYTLQSSQQKIDMVCGFNNGVLTQCGTYVTPETVVHPSAGELQAKAMDFLQKYQAYSGVNCSRMIDLLSKMESTNAALSLGNLTLTVSTMELTSNQGSLTSFSYAARVNGCDYKELSFGFKNGVFYGMNDKTSMYTIGDTTVNLNRKQAVDIAMVAIQNYSYKMADDYWVSDFKIAGNDANLIPVEKDGVLYPCWQVKLYTDGVYPGSVHGLLVHVWAASGEAFNISNIAYSTPTDYQNRADL
jgi:hypothetical protein